MEMYKALKPNLVEYDYIGELLHHVEIKQTCSAEYKIRRAITTIEERKHDRLIHLYYNGTRITGKRISKDKPKIVESYTLLNGLAMDIALGNIK